jgi:NhaP-type Na+/H+ or K+/H+ antiporter
MALSLAIIGIAGLSANVLFKKIKLPGLLGMLLVGIILGPYLLNVIQPQLLQVSSDLREIALIVILLRAGFEMSRKTIGKIGKTALLLSFIPATFEIAGTIILAPKLLGISILEAGILGAILGAVSPAVVVPYMIELQQNKTGTDKNIPGLLIAASSVDDVYVIVIFTSLLGMYGGENINLLWSFAGIPISIISGCVLGAIIGFILVWLFKKIHMRDTIKIIIIISVSILLTFIESVLKGIVPVSGLLAVMATGVILLEKYEKLVHRISPKFEKIWVGAQILLFVLVGTQVDISVALNTGLAGIAVILGALVFRSLGVYVGLIGSGLNNKEKLFCILAYIPKATVQAAIGAVPLAYDVASGNIILAVAVLSILLTAPLGAIAIKLTENKLLNKEITESIKIPLKQNNIRINVIRE